MLPISVVPYAVCVSSTQLDRTAQALRCNTFSKDNTVRPARHQGGGIRMTKSQNWLGNLLHDRWEWHLIANSFTTGLMGAPPEISLRRFPPRRELNCPLSSFSICLCFWGRVSEYISKFILLSIIKTQCTVPQVETRFGQQTTLQRIRSGVDWASEGELVKLGGYQYWITGGRGTGNGQGKRWRTD